MGKIRKGKDKEMIVVYNGLDKSTYSTETMGAMLIYISWGFGPISIIVQDLILQ